MKPQPISTGLVLLLALGSLLACGGSGQASLGGGGRLEIRLIDAPVDLSTASSLFVTIDGVSVFPGVAEMDGADAAPIVVMNHPATFDLLTLTGGASLLLASAELPAGFYQRIRLDIASARLDFQDGSSEALQIEAGKVDVPIRFEVREGETAEVTLDFQAGASVQVNQTASGRFILRPVVVPIPL